MKTQHATLVALLFAAGTGLVHAADIGNGKQLQQKNCMSCHDDGMYTRENRKVTTPDGLTKQVRRCESTLGLQWFDEDVDDVSAYLNESFYKFK
jgi:mono/diheme cytochrome c family protein